MYFNLISKKSTYITSNQSNLLQYLQITRKDIFYDANHFLISSFSFLLIVIETSLVFLALVPDIFFVNNRILFRSLVNIPSRAPWTKKCNQNIFMFFSKSWMNAIKCRNKSRWPRLSFPVYSFKQRILRFGT